MKGFIVDRTYRVIDGQAFVYCFGRLANGESYLTINHYKPYFYIRARDEAQARTQLTSLDASFAPDAKTTMRGEPVVKITLSQPRDVATARRVLEDAGIPCYEADIRFTQRFLMDHGIYATMDIQGPHKKGRHVNRIYEEPLLTPVDYIPQLVTASFDIETSYEGTQLYCLTITTGKRSATLMVRDPQHPKQLEGVQLYNTEKELLEMFTELLNRWDPDIITGWNCIDFDLAFLKKKYEEHKLPFTLGRTDWPATLRLEKSFLKDSQASIPGRVVLDGIHILKSSFISLDDYKLETAAQAILGEGKLLTGPARHHEIERLYHEDPRALAAYNKRDAELVLDILNKRQLIELTTLRSMLTGMTLDRVRASIASFDSVYIRHLNAEGKVAPTTRYTERRERITGGYVRDSKPGIYSNIVVLDFKSMYPSVIRTFNIDPASHLPDCTRTQTDREVIVSPNGACFKNTDGILPRIIQRLWEQRDAAKRRKDATASFALKTLMNSFFGVLASPNSRFFSLDMGNAITHFARHFIKMAAEKIAAQGYEVIYGDTDSVFVHTKKERPEDAWRVGEQLQQHINTFYDEYVQQHYFRKNFMELEAEKVYTRFLLPRIRGSDVGAKKRYAGLLWTGNGEKLDFTGLEFVRRDWTELAKTFQLGLLDRIFHDQPVTDWIQRFVEDLKRGKLDDQLVYRKGVRKELSSYTKTTPPHVKAARLLEERGGTRDGSVIEYVMTMNGPEPLGYETAPIDYHHYIEKQIKPIADSVLSFYDTSFDELIAGSSQTTLASFSSTRKA